MSVLISPFRYSPSRQGGNSKASKWRTGCSSVRSALPRKGRMSGIAPIRDSNRHERLFNGVRVRKLSADNYRFILG